MSNKGSDNNVANIEDVKNVKEFIDYAQEVIDDMEYERPVDVTVYQKYLTSMQSILAEREQDKKRIQELKIKLKCIKDLYDDCCKCLLNSIPKQVVKDKIKEIKRLRDKCITSEGYNIMNGEIIVLQELLEGGSENNA